MRLWVEPTVIAAIAALPGNMRQRIRQAVRGLPSEPRPAQSRELTLPAELQVAGVEVRRLRMNQWRIIYSIDHELEIISVLAVKRRPPYTYDDLSTLLHNP